MSNLEKTTLYTSSHLICKHVFYRGNIIISIEDDITDMREVNLTMVIKLETRYGRLLLSDQLPLFLTNITLTILGLAMCLA